MVDRFEELIAWQKSRALTKRIYQLTSSGDFAKDFALRDQIRKSAVSVMSNIAEGFERGRPGEFSYFLSIAKASCAELRSQLYIASDVAHISDDVFQLTMKQSEEVGKIIGGLRAAVEKKKKVSKKQKEN